MGDGLVFDLLREMPEDEGRRLDIRTTEQLVALCVHPPGRGECGRLEAGGVGDAEAGAEASFEKAVALREPALDPTQRGVLLGDDLVEASMLTGVLTLLSEVLVDVGPQDRIVDVDRGPSHRSHHVRLAVGHPDRQGVHGGRELRLLRLPRGAGVRRPFELDRPVFDAHVLHGVSIGRGGADWSEAAPSAGLEPAHTPPEGDALSAELRGLAPTGEASG